MQSLARARDRLVVMENELKYLRDFGQVGFKVVKTCLLFATLVFVVFVAMSRFSLAILHSQVLTGCYSFALYPVFWQVRSVHPLPDWVALTHQLSDTYRLSRVVQSASSERRLLLLRQEELRNGTLPVYEAVLSSSSTKDEQVLLQYSSSNICPHCHHHLQALKSACHYFVSMSTVGAAGS
jgi:hypothetical protein